MISWSTILFPTALTLSMFPLPYVGGVARILIIVSVAQGFLYLSRGLKKTELQWIILTVLYLAATLVSALYAVDISEALIDLIRQVYIFGVAILLMVSLRNFNVRVIFLYSMVFMFIASALLICGLYILFQGLSIVSLDEIRSFKFSMANHLNIALNPISFAMTQAFLLSFPTWSRNKWIASSFIILFSIAVVLSGSRATLVSVLISFLITGLIIWSQKRDWYLRWGLYLAIGIIIFLLITTLPSRLQYLVTPEWISELTTGRWDLWVAGWTKFLDRPLIGWGAGSWSIDLASYLPIYDPYRYESLLSLESGAFHNSYLTLMAEKGLVTFIPSLIILVFLTRSSWKLYRNKHNLSVIDSSFAQIAPVIMISMLVRSFGEQPGLFGYANGTVDFLSFATTSLIVAIAAQLDINKKV